MKTNEKNNRSARAILLGIDGADPVFVKKLVKQKLLPNFERIMQEGFFTPAMPSFPAKTPQNWTTIATGAEPGTHEITDLFVQPEGESLAFDADILLKQFNDFNGFDSGLSQAEFLWNTVENNGKKVIVFNYACATPSTLKSNIWIGGSGEPGTSGLFTIAKPMVLILEQSQIDRTIEIQNLPNDCVIEGVWTLPVLPTTAEEEQNTIAAKVRDRTGSAVVFLGSPDWNDQKVLVREGEYSEFICGEFIDPINKHTVRGAYCYKVISLGETIKIYRSKIYPVEGLSKPAGIYEELIERFGPFIEEPPNLRRLQNEITTYNEVNRMQVRWLANSIAYLMKTQRPDLLMVKMHIVDHYGHDVLNESVQYQEGDASKKEYHDALIEAYRIVDDMLGIVLGAAENDDHVMVVSDHGCVPTDYNVFVNDILVKDGLIESGTDNDAIDFKRTKALAVRHGGYIFINIKGRQKDGCVAPEDYEKVQEQIIDALLDYRCPVTGKCPFSFVIRKQDAGMLGFNQNSVHCGDVLYALRAGYWSDIRYKNFEDDFSSENFKQKVAYVSMGMHGDIIPGGHYKGHSDMALFMGIGNEFKKGYEFEKVFKLTRVASTIAQLIGIPAPANSEGAPLLDVFE